MSTKKLTTFNVMVNVKGEFNISVKADSLETAIVAARAMKTIELLDNVDDWNDYEHEITGVFK